MYSSVLFSQKFSSKYYSSPLIVNPANTGRFIGGDYRISGISRAEKNVFYQDMSYAFSFDTRILKGSLPEEDKAAIALGALSETDRYLGIKNSNLLISAAYFKGLNGEGIEQLSIGFQANIATRKLETPSYIFADQLLRWESSGFTGVLSERQVIAVNYFDLNAGVYYQNHINHKYLLSLGVSILHANQPHQTFNGGEFSIKSQLCLQGGVEISLLERNKLQTNFTADGGATGKAIDNFSIGCIYQMAIGQTINKISIGSFFRNDNRYGTAISPFIGLKFNSTSINMAYDITVSEKTSLQKNAFELGMVYIGRMAVKK